MSCFLVHSVYIWLILIERLIYTLQALHYNSWTTEFWLVVCWTVSRISSGTRQSAPTLSDVCWRRICLRDTSACSALEVDNFMRYINLLTYLHCVFTDCVWTGGNAISSIHFRSNFWTSDLCPWPFAYVWFVTIALLGLKVKVRLKKWRSEVETRSVGPWSSVEDSFLVEVIILCISVSVICMRLYSVITPSHVS